MGVYTLEDPLSRSMSYMQITSTYMKVELALFSDINRVSFEPPMWHSHETTWNLCDGIVVHIDIYLEVRVPVDQMNLNNSQQTLLKPLSLCSVCDVDTVPSTVVSHKTPYVMVSASIMIQTDASYAKTLARLKLVLKLYVQFLIVSCCDPENFLY